LGAATGRSVEPAILTPLGGGLTGLAGYGGRGDNITLTERKIAIGIINQMGYIVTDQ
jgi:hypothetical protein